jgi:hypothetical protein
MRRPIAEVYRHYEVPPNVQRHMLRVAAVAEQMGRHWHGPPLRRERLVTVLLVHDLGNIVKCDYVNLPHMLEEEQGRVEHWRAVQARYQARFGTDDHLATHALAREVGLDDAALGLLDRMAFEHNDETAAGGDLEAKIAAYADHRVGPRGVLSLADRFAEIKQRYRGAAGAFMQSARAEELIDCAYTIEKQLALCCGLAPADIDDASIRPWMESLRGFEVGSPALPWTLP